MDYYGFNFLWMIFGWTISTILVLGHYPLLLAFITPSIFVVLLVIMNKHTSWISENENNAVSSIADANKLTGADRGLYITQFVLSIVLGISSGLILERVRGFKGLQPLLFGLSSSGVSMGFQKVAELYF